MIKTRCPKRYGLKTAEMIAEVRESKKQGHPEEKELIEGARGADYDGIRLHSVRLPGMIAHQEVLFEWTDRRSPFVMILITVHPLCQA